MKAQTARLSDRLSQSLPKRETLAAHPWLRPVAKQLLHPQLWRFQHESVARGVAIGTFWAFVIPFAQVLVAAAHCTWWRANIPVAAAMTMVTNPLTIGFWLWLAYQVGTLVLGPSAGSVASGGDGATTWLAEFGWPAIVGMGIFAFAGAALAYVAVKLGRRLRIGLKLRARRATL